MGGLCGAALKNQGLSPLTGMKAPFKTLSASNTVLSRSFQLDALFSHTTGSLMGQGLCLLGLPILHQAQGWAHSHFSLKPLLWGSKVL